MGTVTEGKKKPPSPEVKSLSARLRAVQALYQAEHNKQSMRAVLDEYLQHRSEMEVEGEVGGGLGGVWGGWGKDFGKVLRFSGFGGVGRGGGS